MGHSRLPRMGLGLWALAVALVALVALTFLPTPYVIQQPGPVFNVLGSVSTGEKGGKEVPLVKISGAETYPTGGSLDLTTVQLANTPEHTPSWFQLALAWTDPSRAVVPMEAVFPKGVSSEEREEQNASLMVDSQSEATMAALSELDYDVPTVIRVKDVGSKTPAEGVIQIDDVLTGVNGASIADGAELRDTIQSGGGRPVDITVLRDGKEQTFTLKPEKVKENGETFWRVGIEFLNEYQFPITVKIQLDNVGGPSAGQMFALGIIDQLTPGELNGGADVAGTGTINADGEVGSIGGIRQKLYGARSAGAEFFLAPEQNCNEVVGHVPDGLQVIRTSTLKESLAALEVIASGTGVDSLPTCEVSAAE